MNALHVVLGYALIAVNLAAGLWGAWGWWRHRHAPGFWPLLRVGQGLVILQAAGGAVLLLMGRDLPELHLIYGLVPLGVSFIAEQLRLAAADTVLAQRDLEGRADVEALPEPSSARWCARSCAARWASWPRRRSSSLRSG